MRRIFIACDTLRPQIECGVVAGVDFNCGNTPEIKVEFGLTFGRSLRLAAHHGSSAKPGVVTGIEATGRAASLLGDRLEASRYESLIGLRECHGFADPGPSSVS
jgi:hypothetical protein